AGPGLGGFRLDADGFAFLRTAFPAGFLARRERLLDDGGQIVRTVAGADGDRTLSIFAGQEALGRLVEGELAARLREEMDGRRPARRGEQRIDGDDPRRAAGFRLYRDRGDAQPAAGLRHRMAGKHLDAERP